VYPDQPKGTREKPYACEKKGGIKLLRGPHNTGANFLISRESSITQKEKCPSPIVWCHLIIPQRVGVRVIVEEEAIVKRAGETGKKNSECLAKLLISLE